MDRIIVTGATGHVGANLVRALLERGADVRALVRQDDPEALRGLDIERVRGDVREPDTLERAMQGRDVLYHAAGLISIAGPMGGLVDAVNVSGTRNVAEAALRCGVRRMVHFCSVHAFDQAPLLEPLDENRARVRPGSGPAYDVSKAAGEAAVRALLAEGLDAVILHPSAIIGPHDYKPSIMGQLFLELYHRRLPSLVEGGFDWVDVRDVVDTALAALERGRSGESYILSGHWRSIAELAGIVERVTGVAVPRFTSPQWLARAGAPFMEAWAKVTASQPLYTSESLLALRANRHYVRDKAARELGHDPRPTEQSVQSVYRWFARMGRLPEALLERLDGEAESA